MNEEFIEISSLRRLGLADQADEARWQELVTENPQWQDSDSTPETEDCLVEALLAASKLAQPSVLLKERVMAATDPSAARVVTDAHCGILSISRAFTDLCGYTLEEIKGRSPGSFLQGPATDPAAVEFFREAIRLQKPCTVEILNYHKCGSPYRVRVEMRPIFAPDSGQLLGYTALETKIA